MTKRTEAEAAGEAEELEMTYCDTCDNVTLESRKASPWHWQCIKHPRREGFGWVTSKQWVNYPPYGFCKDLNLGACPLWAQRKEEDDENRTSVSK